MPRKNKQRFRDNSVIIIVIAKSDPQQELHHVTLDDPGMENIFCGTQPTYRVSREHVLLLFLFFLHFRYDFQTQNWSFQRDKYDRILWIFFHRFAGVSPIVTARLPMFTRIFWETVSTETCFVKCAKERVNLSILCVLQNSTFRKCENVSAGIREQKILISLDLFGSVCLVSGAEQ